MVHYNISDRFFNFFFAVPFLSFLPGAIRSPQTESFLDLLELPYTFDRPPANNARGGGGAQQGEGWRCGDNDDGRT